MLISQGETYFQAQNKDTIDVRENVISQPCFTIRSFRVFLYVVSNDLGRICFCFVFNMCSKVLASFNLQLPKYILSDCYMSQGEIKRDSGMNPDLGDFIVLLGERDRLEESKEDSISHRADEAGSVTGS